MHCDLHVTPCYFTFPFILHYLFSHHGFHTRTWQHKILRIYIDYRMFWKHLITCLQKTITMKLPVIFSFRVGSHFTFIRFDLTAKISYILLPSQLQIFFFLLDAAPFALYTILLIN